MIYSVLRQLLRITLRVYFKHIHVSHAANLPFNKPMLIAANHPGALLDPILIACFLKKPIYFLVRGDVFKNKFIRHVLKSFNMIPVYRINEGYENIEKNNDTNIIVAEVLKKKGIVVIFCEGYSATDRRLLEIRKGTARIGMQTAVAEKIDVQIVPLGITYTHKTNFRKSVILDFSNPIAVIDYLEEYQIHPQRSFVSITAEIKNRLQEDFVVIRNPECDTLCELHLNYSRNTETYPPVPILLRDDKKLKIEREICYHINALYETHKLNYEALNNETLAYERELMKNGCNDFGIVANPITIKTFILLVLGFPLFIAGLLFWGAAYGIAKTIADRKVTRIDFHDAITINITNVIFSLFIFITTVVYYNYIGIFSILIALLIPLACIFAGWYFDTLVRAYYIKQAGAYRAKLKVQREGLVKKVISGSPEIKQ